MDLLGGNVNLSDIFIAIISGTTKEGNHGYAVAEAIRKDIENAIKIVEEARDRAKSDRLTSAYEQDLARLQQKLWSSELLTGEELYYFSIFFSPRYFCYQ